MSELVGYEWVNDDYFELNVTSSRQSKPVQPKPQKDIVFGETIEFNVNIKWVNNRLSSAYQYNVVDMKMKHTQ